MQIRGLHRIIYRIYRGARTVVPVSRRLSKRRSVATQRRRAMRDGSSPFTGSRRAMMGSRQMPPPGPSASRVRHSRAGRGSSCRHRHGRTSCACRATIQSSLPPSSGCARSIRCEARTSPRHSCGERASRRTIRQNAPDRSCRSHWGISRLIAPLDGGHDEMRRHESKALQGATG